MITSEEYFALLLDVESSDAEIMKYSVVVEGVSGFDFQLAPNPELVEGLDDSLDNENAMQIGNRLAKWRRNAKFRSRWRKDKTQPVIISEGDSWFQFPFLIDDTIDHLSKTFLIKSIGEAGDTLENMTNGSGHNNAEYEQVLDNFGGAIKAFLFSGAGNDFLGTDIASGEPVLSLILNKFNGDATDVEGHINHSELNARVENLDRGYAKIVQNVRARSELKRIPIIFHGYDYVIPYPAPIGENRNPVYAKKDQWLGAPMKAKGIIDPDLRQKIIRHLIDTLYGVLDGFAENDPNVIVVDCRNTLTNVSQWADEIHPNSESFSKVAEKFSEALRHQKIPNRFSKIEMKT